MERTITNEGKTIKYPLVRQIQQIIGKIAEISTTLYIGLPGDNNNNIICN